MRLQHAYTQHERYFFRALTILAAALDRERMIVLRNMALIQAAKDMGLPHPHLNRWGDEKSDIYASRLIGIDYAHRRRQVQLLRRVTP